MSCLHLISSELNLTGLQRISRYHKGIQKGLIKVDAVPEVIFETPVTAVLDAHDGMGQLVAYKAMNMAIEKAKKKWYCNCKRA